MKVHRIELRACALLLLVCGCLGSSATVSDAQSVVDTHPAGTFVMIGGHRIWYESKGHGASLLLIPGGPGYSHDYFHPFFSELSDGHRFIYYDPFGTGKSDRAKTAVEYSLKQEIDEVEELRKALGIERWDVFGHSWGGVVAQGYAIEHSSSVVHLIASDSPVSGKSLQDSNDRVNQLTAELFPDNRKKIQTLRARGLNSTSVEMAKAAPPIFQYVALYKREGADSPPPGPGFIAGR